MEHLILTSDVLSPVKVSCRIVPAFKKHDTLLHSTLPSREKVMRRSVYYGLRTRQNHNRHVGIFRIYHSYFVGKVLPAATILTSTTTKKKSSRR